VIGLSRAYTHRVAKGAVGALLPLCACGQRKRSFDTWSPEPSETATTQTADAKDPAQKCSDNARQWFRTNFSADQDTLLLDFRGHYDRTKNGCFVLVEKPLHVRFGNVVEERSQPWGTSPEMSAWQNSRKKTCLGSHEHPKSRNGELAVQGQKCSGADPFHVLIHPFTADQP
jgi:hypothetical protein